MPSIYQLKPAFQNLLRPSVQWLYAKHISANQVTLLAM
nr:CDP-alcohol phosphatidyltransferase family protein [Acinetobacter sp.]